MSLRVLVIEDQDDSREALCELLDLMGVAAMAATNVQDAMVMIAAVPDIVLCDIGLPGADGYELAERLQQHPQRGRFKLVAVTGFVSDVDQRRAIAAGFDVVLTKPLKQEALEAILRTTRGK